MTSKCVLVLLAVSAAQAQTPCYFFLINHVDFTTNLGFSLDLESSSCQLGSLVISMQTGNGNRRVYASAAPKWQLEHNYTVKLIVTNGSQQMFLDGQLVGSSRTGFKPMQGALHGAEIPIWGNGQADYTIEQTRLEITNGMQSALLPTAVYTAPSPQNVLLGGPPVWMSGFTEDPTQTVNVTAKFTIHASISSSPSSGYIDRYGQAAYGTWPSRVNSDNDLQTAIATEQIWLGANPAPAGLDQYGGSTLAGWQDTATGYFHTAFHNNRWWLISPLGNPAFYIALDGVPSQSNFLAAATPTPITGRIPEFAELPPTTTEFSAAYTGNYYADPADTGLVTVWFGISNLIRKYGPQWRTTYSSIVLQRLGSWVFTGMGKWSATDSSLTLPYIPVLGHDSALNVIPNGHPDVFDPNTIAGMQTYFRNQIGSKASNPRILGWSVGDEIAENIQPSEITAIMALPGRVPAKQALVNQALAGIYGGNLATLASAWRISAAKVLEFTRPPRPSPREMSKPCGSITSRLTIRRLIRRSKPPTPTICISAAGSIHPRTGSILPTGTLWQLIAM
jgi:hypothetical protein